ncbi:MAG: diguanylate cyclase [Symploca sp. SIO2B6]|nr:diguanylate cyclase [Symploca sp. SIO2B6]
MTDVNIDDIGSIMKYAEQLIFTQTKIYCSELQRSLLLSVLQGERKNYEQIAAECGYSVTYIRQDVAPKLWQTFSHALKQKVTKANVKTILEKAILTRVGLRPELDPTQDALQNAPQSEAPSPASKAIAISPLPTVSTAAPSPSELPLSANILLVDDQPKNLRLLADLLEEQGYEVQEAINGPIALQVVSVAPPDLVLLDIHMPEMDGYVVCQQLKSNPKTRDIPVIFISAVDEAWDKVKAFSVGGVDYITKPFKVVEVLARVKNQLKVQQLQQELKAQNAQLQQAIQELQRLAVIDHVTQVASRYRFDQHLQVEWQQAIEQETSLSLMLCHLDEFEGYLQRYGYQAGDRCLYQIAHAIRRVAQRPEDLVARYGGEIFVIVLPNMEKQACEAVAQNILVQISALPIYQPPSVTSDLSAEQDTISLTASIGMASLVPRKGLGLEDLVEGCDRALQKAKGKGGNTVITSAHLD